MKVNVIFAQGRGGVIGSAGRLPWRCPADMRRFTDLTVEGTVIMGRKTWDSLPETSRPLIARRNIVVTGQVGKTFFCAETAHSFKTALALVKPYAPWNNVWVIGGAQIYREAMPFADSIYVTEIDEDFRGDTFAPEIPSYFGVVAHETAVCEKSGLSLAFKTYERFARES